MPPQRTASTKPSNHEVERMSSSETNSNLDLESIKNDIEAFPGFSSDIKVILVNLLHTISQRERQYS